MIDAFYFVQFGDDPREVLCLLLMELPPGRDDFTWKLFSEDEGLIKWRDTTEPIPVKLIGRRGALWAGTARFLRGDFREDGASEDDCGCIFDGCGELERIK